jgi:hypothetical protein
MVRWRSTKWLEKEGHALWREFDASMHRQLSYSSMAEPGFDPAELAFALEGALILQRTWVGNSVIENVFEALKLRRERHPMWRPTAPFLASSRGEVLFMVSVEVANAILRCCEILDKSRPQPIHFSLCEPQLRTYANWLLGEKEEYYDGKHTVIGWRTDYDTERNKVQLWHTSPVLLFLTHYASLLKRKIAGDGIQAAGLSVRLTDDKPSYWDGESVPAKYTLARWRFSCGWRTDSLLALSSDVASARFLVPVLSCLRVSVSSM